MKTNADSVNPLSELSADRWAEAAGVVCARAFRPALLHIIVSQGEDEFIRIVRPIYAGHGFSQKQFKRIYAIIKRTAELNPVNSNDPNIEMING